MDFILIRSKNVVLKNEVKEACIVINNGKFSSVEDIDFKVVEQDSVVIEDIDATDLVVMPGLVDSHVHINEPGRTEWEGFETATRAAAAGGITTVVDMPLNCIPATTSLEGLNVKIKRARACNIFVDLAFWGGVIPGNENELKPMIAAGVRGFKCFLINSGVPEFPEVTELDLHKAIPKLVGTKSVLLFHAELDIVTGSTAGANVKDHKTFVATRPSQMESSAVKLICDLCKKYNVRCHIVHLSSADSLPYIRQLQAEGYPITAETCYHYLTLTSDEVPEGATQYKCCPPIRDSHHQDELWDAIKDGTISQVVSDHSPCTADLKLLDEGDFLKAWGGISSVQFGLSLLWTHGRQRNLTFIDISRLCCQATAQLASLDTKGSIVPGNDADLVIWDPTSQFKITTDLIEHKNKVTPYLGKTLYGVVKRTILHGKTIYMNGNVMPNASGNLILS